MIMIVPIIISYPVMETLDITIEAEDSTSNTFEITFLQGCIGSVIPKQKK